MAKIIVPRDFLIEPSMSGIKLHKEATTLIGVPFPHACARGEVRERQNSKILIGCFVDCLDGSRKILFALTALLFHIFGPLLFYEVHQAWTEHIGPFPKSLLKYRRRGQRVDRRFELLDVVHYRCLAEPDQALPEHAGSAFWRHVFVESGMDAVHVRILPTSVRLVVRYN